jgi:hypothetical protein
MSKVVYASYKLDYPELDFQEETLKEKLWETLRETLWELKIETSNEKGSYIMVF